jgi:hypothetical protein
MNRFFDDLGARWVAAAGRRSARIEPPSLDAGVAQELLELARAAAYTHERRFAPLSCFMAGVAAERLRVAKAGTDDAAVAAFILEVRQELEKENPAPPSER